MNEDLNYPGGTWSEKYMFKAFGLVDKVNAVVPTLKDDIPAKLATDYSFLSSKLEESRAFRTALTDQLVRNGHPEDLRNMSEFELLSYIVNALGGTVMK